MHQQSSRHHSHAYDFHAIQCHFNLNGCRILFSRDFRTRNSSSSIQFKFSMRNSVLLTRSWILCAAIITEERHFPALSFVCDVTFFALPQLKTDEKLFIGSNSLSIYLRLSSTRIDLFFQIKKCFNSIW